MTFTYHLAVHITSKKEKTLGETGMAHVSFPADSTWSCYHGMGIVPVLDQGSRLVLELHCIVMPLISQHVDKGKTMLLLQVYYFTFTVKVK